MSSSTTTERVFNFSAGPAVLPEPVLEQVREELFCLPGVGSSVMEISHRSPAFVGVLDDARERIASLHQIPDDYEVLFVQGGATLQNAMIPANFLVDREQTADCIITGTWGKKNSQDVSYYGKLNVAWDGSETGFTRTPEQSELNLTEGAAYCHYTSNETIHGVQFRDPPGVGEAPLVVDQSSDFLSEPLDIQRFGLIYACAQKNCGIAGVTALIIRHELLERSESRLPRYLDYAQHAKGASMLNTPPTFAVYVTGLVCKWIQETVGGLEAMHRLNQEKAGLLYELIDQSDGFYSGHAQPSSRSLMNVVFRLPSAELDAKFVAEAGEQGMTGLNGHRSVGGIRASIYNAMPLGGVQALADFMRDFVQRNG
ncbi:MAG: 3-phosphoserine/phosphohydroxythreonine transaminase [Mariniblastus sp.]|nr:3-phosphoserine/phosphohydroxythreonine transaminase [Mariniblastus sp.]